MKLVKESLDYLLLLNPDMVFMVDVEGNILNANAVVEQMMGYKSNECYKQPFDSFVVAEDTERFMKYYNMAMKGDSHKFKIRVITKNGDPLYVIIKVIPMMIKNTVHGIFIILINITSTKRDFQKMSSSDQIYPLLSGNSLDMISVHTIDGKFRYASPISKQITGYDAKELKGSFYYKYVHPIDLTKVMNNYFKNKDTGNILTFTYRFRRKDGTYIWFETNVQLVQDPITKEPIEFLSISRDVTERKKTEETLKNNERRFRLLVDESPYAVIIMKNTNIDFVNDTCVKLLAASNKKELIGKNILTFIHADYHDIVKKRLKKVLSGEAVNVLEEKWIRLDDKEIDVEVKSIPTIYNGKPAVHTVITDISERKRMHELAQKSEKIALVGQLAAGMAHEIRNPLTSLKGFLELIGSEKSAKKEYLEIMSSELSRIELITNELLVLANPQMEIFSNNMLQTLIEHVVALMNSEAILHNIEMIVNFDQSPIWIYCNENQIKQVFINIIKNAIDEMPNGGMIEIEARQKDGKAIITITDQGPGISQDEMIGIGEPFYTTKEKGTGLGMMVSYQIMKHHKGNIQIRSTVNTGTTFEITLPVALKAPNQVT